MSTSGRLVVVDGIDGSGKTTLIRGLAERLGDRAVVTQAVGGSPLGDVLRRELLSDSGRQLARETRLLLFAANWIDVCQRVIRPALADGKIVLCDRGPASIVAYQGVLCSHDLRSLLLALNGHMADLFVVMDVPVETAVARCDARRGGRGWIESAPAGELEHRRALFWGQAANRVWGPSLRLDGTLATDQLVDQVLARMEDSSWRVTTT